MDQDPLRLQLIDRLERIDDLSLNMCAGLGAYAALLARECFILRRILTRPPDPRTRRLDLALRTVIAQGRILCLDDLLAELHSRVQK